MEEGFSLQDIYLSIYNKFDELVAEDGVCESEFVFDEEDRLVRPIAIETKDAIYAPIHDIQGNIVKLIDIDTREVISLEWADPYGRGLSKTSPTRWIFSGKSYDKEADLVYFGARYYSPALKRWLTPDPFYQTDDPYEYCFNNPFAYVDPDGRWAFTLIGFAWGAGATLTAPVWGTCALALGAGAAAGYAGCKMYEYWQDKSQDRMEAHKAKEGKQKDCIPNDHKAQNKQFEGACKEVERKLGKRLSEKEKRRLHDRITKQGCGYHDIVEEG